MKNVLTHMKSCRSNQSCRLMECCILRYLTIHRKNCIDFECAICAAFLQRDLQQLRIKCNFSLVTFIFKMLIAILIVIHLLIEGVATGIAVLSARRARKTVEYGSEKRPPENTAELFFKKPLICETTTALDFGH